LPLLLVACSSGSGSSPPAADGSPPCETFHVATNGDDASGDGSATAPFLTLERARQAVRADTNRGRCPIDVQIAAGTYALTDPLRFDAGDSGSVDAPVTYRAAPENTGPVVISGGVPVSDFTCDSANLCTADVAGLPARHDAATVLCERRARHTRANQRRNRCERRLCRVPEGYKQLLPHLLSHPELVEAVTATQWKMMRCPVASIADGLTLVMAQPCWDNANTYPEPWNFQLLSWLENAPEFVTEPGMWYLDPNSQQITYLNDSADLPQHAVLPVLERLVELVGTPAAPVTDIRFAGLQFSHATWLEPNSANGYVADQSGQYPQRRRLRSQRDRAPAGDLQDAGQYHAALRRRITFDGNTFIHLGATALDLDTGSQHNRVENNTFTDISSAAIAVGGFTQGDMRPDSAHETADNRIANNRISHTGRDYYDSAAIFVGFTARTVITHNTISYTPWAGVAIGWGWGLFDQGGFPGLPHATPNQWGTYDTPTVQQGNEISGNLFEHFLEKLWGRRCDLHQRRPGPGIRQRAGDPAERGEVQARCGRRQHLVHRWRQAATSRSRKNVSIDNPVGTVDFGPCLTGSSFETLCLATGLVSYGADMGGCLPVGDLTYDGNYLPDTTTFFGPNLCSNSYIPPYPVNLVFIDNVPTTSAADVPGALLQQAGAQ
jgi:hypothetical protein